MLNNYLIFISELIFWWCVFDGFEVNAVCLIPETPNQTALTRVNNNVMNEIEWNSYTALY